MDQEPEATNMEGEMAEADVAEMMGFSSFGRKRKHADGPLAARPAPGNQPSNAAGQDSTTAGPPPGAPSLPAKPENAFGTRPARGDRHQGRTWWVGYYDPTSNENPWEILERKAGLEPLGQWLPRGHARQERARDAGASVGAGASREPAAPEGAE